MNSTMLAAVLGGWKILVIALVVLGGAAMLGGTVLFIVRLVRRGQSPMPGQPSVRRMTAQG